MSAPSAPSTPASPLLLWRWLALCYDAWPMLGLWMLLSAGFTLGYSLAGHAGHDNISPFSAWQWLLWLCCWMLTGTYATVSWRHGGQTLGMRPWRLRLIALDGTARLPWPRLWRRYALGSLSLLLGGLGFWWAWIDREHLTWHDRASGTRLIRAPKNQAD